MKNDFEYFENEWMVNHNHQKVKAQEYQIPKYTDHEIRMAQLRRKAEADRPKVELEAVKYGLIAIVMLPVFWILFRLMIACMWAYSFAVRGF